LDPVGQIFQPVADPAEFFSHMESGSESGERVENRISRLGVVFDKMSDEVIGGAYVILPVAGGQNQLVAIFELKI